MKIIWWFVRLLVFLLLLLFALQNQHTITLHGLFGTQATWPLAWVLALTLAVGALLGVLAMLPRALRRKTPATTLTEKTEAPHPVEDHGLGV